MPSRTHQLGQPVEPPLELPAQEFVASGRASGMIDQLASDAIRRASLAPESVEVFQDELRRRRRRARQLDECHWTLRPLLDVMADVPGPAEPSLEFVMTGENDDRIRPVPQVTSMLIACSRQSPPSAKISTLTSASGNTSWSCQATSWPTETQG